MWNSLSHLIVKMVTIIFAIVIIIVAIGISIAYVGNKVTNNHYHFKSKQNIIVIVEEK